MSPCAVLVVLCQPVVCADQDHTCMHHAMHLLKFSKILKKKKMPLLESNHGNELDFVSEGFVSETQRDGEGPPSVAHVPPRR